MENKMSLLEQAEQFIHQSREEPIWLKTIRAEAWNTLETQGFPTNKSENWKYTKLGELLKFRHCEGACDQSNRDQKQLSNKKEGLFKAGLLRFARKDDTNGDFLVFIDGLFAPSLSHIENSKIEIRNFAELFKEKSPHPLLSKYLTQYAEMKSPGFNALNTCMMQDGAFIYIPKNIIIKEPIQLLFINSGTEVASHIRNLFVVGENSRVSIVETYTNQQTRGTPPSPPLTRGESILDLLNSKVAENSSPPVKGELEGVSAQVKNSIYFTNTVTEIILEAKSQLNYYKIQQEGAAAFHIHSLYTQQAEHSQFKSINIDKGGKLVRNWLQSNLTAPEATSDFAGLYVARDSQYIDNHTRVEHLSPHTTSREFYKGVLFDKSQAVFNGQIFIAPDAQKSDAQQTNRNLVLSDQAEVDTKPQLEIYADDVKCSHGATVADLSEDILFYLQSRGIPPDEAQGILLDGFMNEILDRISEAVLPLLRGS